MGWEDGLVEGKGGVDGVVVEGESGKERVEEAGAGVVCDTSVQGQVSSQNRSRSMLGLGRDRLLHRGYSAELQAH